MFQCNFNQFLLARYLIACHLHLTVDGNKVEVVNNKILGSLTIHIDNLNIFTINKSVHITSVFL